jgi:hypothetical protein
MALTLSGGFAVQIGSPAALSPAKREKGKRNHILICELQYVSICAARSFGSGT